MITFIDGPAKGQTLMLRRAPLLLRVVHDGKEWDGLDQFNDTPKDNETVHVYVRVGEPRSVHLLLSKPRRYGWYQVATYKLYAHPPNDAATRKLLLWRQWCLEQIGK